MRFRRPRVRDILFMLYTVFLLVVTIGPIRQRLEGSEAPLGVLSIDRWFEASTWQSGSDFEFTANVVVFVPWGALAVWVFGNRSWWFAAVLGVALTFSIELMQIPLARISDPRDLAANTAGVLIGIVLGVIVRLTQCLLSPPQA